MSRHQYLIDGEPIETEAEKKGDAYSVLVGDGTFDILLLAPGLYSTVVNGRKKTIAVAVANGRTYVDVDSVLFELQEPTAEGFGAGAAEVVEEKDKIFAPMPGKVVKLLVKVGDTVGPKQPAVIVEAMKMENPVQARARGTVKAVNFAVGDQVDTDSPIIELELDGE